MMPPMTPEQAMGGEDIVNEETLRLDATRTVIVAYQTKA